MPDPFGRWMIPDHELKRTLRPVPARRAAWFERSPREMKKAFQVPKDKPKIVVVLTRDSV